jgi:hypothetical protein
MLITSGKWTDFLLTRQSLEALYRESPDIREVHDVTLLRDGPQLNVFVELAALPDPMPLKWVERGCNRVQVLLTLVGIHDLKITAWGTSNPVATEFSGEPRAFRFRFSGPSTNIEGEANYMMIERFSAYRSE